VTLRLPGAIGLLVSLALGCASSGRWQTESATAPGADLAGYASFAWLAAEAPHGNAGEAPLSIADANVRNAIRAQLIEKGYREIEANPDLRIGFETSTRARERTSEPVRIGVGVGSWGGNVGGAVDASVPVGSERVKTVAETRITIRALDPEDGRELWIGSATGEVREGLDADAVAKAVAAVLDDFPARRR
jgi:hypothetical protein